MSEDFEEFDIIDYFEDDYQEYWREQINRSDWKGASKLFDLLSQEKFRDLYGEGAKLFLVTDGETLICYCALVEKTPELGEETSPLLCYMYTFEEYRGNGFMNELVDYILGEINEDLEAVFAAVQEDDLTSQGFEAVKTEELNYGKVSICKNEL